MKSYQVELIYNSCEVLEIPTNLTKFTIAADDIEDAVRNTDKHLYSNHISGHENDFSDDYNHELTVAAVSVSSSETGLEISYRITEI